MNFKNSSIELRFICLILLFRSMGFSQHKPKFSLSVGYHSTFNTQNPWHITNPTFLPHRGNSIWSFQANKTFIIRSLENQRIQIKQGISGYFRPLEFGIPVLSYANTFQLDLIRKLPDTFTIGLDANFQIGKWLIQKNPRDKYSLVFFSIYGAIRPNNYFKKLRLKYYYDLTPFYYQYFELQDIKGSYTYQKGFSLEYTFGDKKTNQITTSTSK